MKHVLVRQAIAASDETGRGSRLGLIAAVTAFLTWGIYPLFFKQLASVNSGEILAHRIVWSVTILMLGLALYPTARRQLRNLRRLRNLAIGAVTAALISINWFSFIHAVNTDRVLEASLGYFLIPVVNAALGAVFLGERLNLFKKAAVLVALGGVISAFLISGVLPVFALAISLSFGIYGLMRKLSPLDAYSGLFLETLVLSPFAFAYLLAFGTPLAEYPLEVMTLLVFAGVMTLIPLLCMVVAARRLEYATLGFVQYLTPLTQFAIAILVYNEHVSDAQLVTFCTVAVAVVLFMYGSLLRRETE